MVDSEVPFSSVLDLVSTCLSFPHKNLLLSHPQAFTARYVFADHTLYVYLQSCPSSFPRAALLTTLRVCVRIWDGVGFVNN